MRAGWGWPGNARKAHYFDENNSVSICGRWMFTGERDENNARSPDDCVACRRIFDKRAGDAAAQLDPS